jgi:hypothetical protein
MTELADFTGGGGATGVATGSGAAAAGALPGVPSRFTNVRLRRTSTWMVRALPVESACLISEVCLRTTVIF